MLRASIFGLFLAGTLVTQANAAGATVTVWAAHPAVLLAQGDGQAGGGGGDPKGDAGKGQGNKGFEPSNLIIFALPILLLYLFIVVLPGRRRQEKERLEAMNKLEKGTEVVTIGGIYGTVISVHPEKDEMVIKVDDGT